MAKLKRMNCICGCLLVSDGDSWVCPLRDDPNYFHDSPSPDKRVTVTRVKLDRPVKVGIPSGVPKRRSEGKARLHKGPIAGCFHCNPDQLAVIMFHKMAAKAKRRRA